MARKDDLHRLADENDVDVNKSDTNAELESKLTDAGVDVPPEDGDPGPTAGGADAQRAAADVEGALPSDEDAQRALGTDRGFTGEKVDPRPNEEYSLESGPDSPTALEGMQAAAEQRVDDLRRSAE